VNRRRTEHKGLTIWFTGLPCSGKSTISQLVFDQLRRTGVKAELFDGDAVRQNLTRGLGFSKEDRDENIRRIGYMCQVLTRNGVIAIAAAISPYRAVRGELRSLITPFIEIYVNCPLEVCKQRDSKGMYKRALAGQLANFTGVSDPYEEPLAPELVLYTNDERPEECSRRVLELIVNLGYVHNGILPNGKSNVDSRPLKR
jgi:adenylylsulfate kinase